MERHKERRSILELDPGASRITDIFFILKCSVMLRIYSEKKESRLYTRETRVLNYEWNQCAI